MASRVVTIVALALAVVAGACVAGGPDAEPTTPPRVEQQPAAESDMVRALEDLAAKPAPVFAGVTGKKGEKQALGREKAPEKLCSRGACPTGYRCGYMVGHPRKVCYAAEAHRAGKALAP